MTGSGSAVADGAGAASVEDADTADAALAGLAEELTACVAGLQAALERSEQLRALRAADCSWREAVSAEARPLIVELVSEALDGLNRAGSRWRREEARSLHAEGLSINAIAALFGVTRQRASVLVRESDAGVVDDGG
ncbi:hypothetical protein [Actinomycetospora cinnamomea]|nr:hypothetical protein [Actinomycetospora cinnamomea]